MGRDAGRHQTTGQIRRPCCLDVHGWQAEAGYGPLRGDPRFEALRNNPKNNAPLF